MFAEPPGVSYIFPAGGQRGSDVAVRVGGFYFHGRTEFKMTGSGITVSPGLKGADTIWFEGPLIFQPNSQRKEDYPKDHLGKIVIAKDAPLGIRRWHCTTSQGTTPSMHFVIGDLPEVVEHEIDGNPIPQTVKLPVTINGRIFPREDVDIWTIELRKGETLHGRVAAKRLGYPLESVVSVTDPHGRSVSVASRQEHGDPVFSFQAPADGRYQVSINDARYDGMQNYVYRLTLSREPIVGVPAVSGGIAMTSGPEVRETEPNDTVESAKVAPVPATLIGAIQKAGDIDCWKLELTEKQMIAVEVHASQSGSPLDSAITVTDEKGKVVAKGDDQPGGNPDASLRFTAPKAGAYWLNVSDRFAGRGGPDFGYRVTVAPAPANDFQLTVVSDAFTATRIDPLNPPEPPSPKKRYARDSGLRIDALAFGKFNGDIELSVTGLPEGVTIENATLAVKKKFVELQFIAATNAPITVSPVTITGTAEIDGEKVTRTAAFVPGYGEPPLEQVRVAVAPHVPFKHVGQYRIVNDYPGGTILRKQYRIERSGYEGPLIMCLADRQGRHLQGATGPRLTIPADVSEIEYPLSFPASLELGRTSRIQLMLIGEMKDFDGSTHVVSYTSFDRGNQMITILTTGRLSVRADQESCLAPPNSEVEIPLTVQRDVSLKGRAVQLELILPDHMKDISATPVTLSAGKSKASFSLKFGKRPGPFNMPVTIRATTIGDGDPHVAESSVELVAPLRTEVRK